MTCLHSFKAAKQQQKTSSSSRAAAAADKKQQTSSSRQAAADKKQQTSSSSSSRQAADKQQQQQTSSSQIPPPPKAGDQGDKGGKGGDQPKVDPKGKGKGSKGNEDKGGKPKAKAEPKASGKATVPCLFWPKGTCTCQFLHDPKAKPAAKPKAAAPANAKATVAVIAAAGGVVHTSAFRTSGNQNGFSNESVLKSSLRAIVRPFIALASIISSCVFPQGFANSATLWDAQASSSNLGAPAILYHDPHALIAQSKVSNHVALEWIADSGAGRDLASSRAFAEQGVHSDMVQRCTQSIPPIKFETGNGSYTADTCVATL